MIGELLDHYRVLELVGRGAMGVVYKAVDVNLDRQVAIKVMSAEARSDPNFVERFRQEARMQGALNHPNVALLFDYFIHDSAPVAVMEFIDGESFEQLIRRRGAIPAHEIIPIFKQALRGVEAAHRAGIIHRDLKPSNLMLTTDGIVKVMDFGIAKRQGVSGATKVSSTSIGSPLYMAPEQILGRAVDCRTDIYALGVTLYELLAGQRPFNARGKAEYLVLDAHVNDIPEPPTVYRFGIPRPIVDAVMRALLKDPDARFQSAEEFICALPDVPAPSARKAAAPAVEATGTVAVEYTPQMSGGLSATREHGGTIMIADTSSTRPGPEGTMAFDFSTGTMWRQLDAPSPAPSLTVTASQTVAANLAPAPPGRTQRSRAHRPVIAAAVLTTLVLGTVFRYADRLRAMLPEASTPVQTSTGTPTPTAASVVPPPAVPDSEPDAPPARSAELAAVTDAAPSAEETAAATVPATATPAATRAATARPDFAGTWRGAYVDASGEQRLRVVSLSISRVDADGGIEGTLQYQAASGTGECKLHPRGSTYSADKQRLQLSPEGCSPHYPKELGVPLDFYAVNPHANTLQDGRIEAPTGEVIRVSLRRVSGV